jgi:hypothetical protein
VRWAWFETSSSLRLLSGLLKVAVATTAIVVDIAVVEVAVVVVDPWDIVAGDATYEGIYLLTILLTICFRAFKGGVNDGNRVVV